MRVALAVLVSLSFAAPASAKKQSVDEGEVTFVFDDTKISPELVKSAARIRPDAQLTADVISSSPSMSLMKVSAKNGWQSWATWGPTWTKQAREELARLRKTSEELAQQKVPTELEPARDYYVNELATMAAREEAKMNYLEHHDVAALKKPIAGADVATKCAPATGKVVAAGTDAASVYKALYFDWSNCALNASSDKKYPQAAWTAFTKKYGVKTKHTSGD